MTPEGSASPGLELRKRCLLNGCARVRLRAHLAITRETVLHVARLARLELAADEVLAMQESLEKILGYVEELGELATDGVPETAHVAAERAPLRDDRLVPSLDTETATAEAPRRSGGGFAVPAFVDE